MYHSLFLPIAERKWFGVTELHSTYSSPPAENKQTNAFWAPPGSQNRYLYYVPVCPADCDSIGYRCGGDGERPVVGAKNAWLACQQAWKGGHQVLETLRMFIEAKQKEPRVMLLGRASSAIKWFCWIEFTTKRQIRKDKAILGTQGRWAPNDAFLTFKIFNVWATRVLGMPDESRHVNEYQ